MTDLTAEEVLAKARAVTNRERAKEGFGHLPTEQEVVVNPPDGTEDSLCFIRNAYTKRIRIVVATDAYATAEKMQDASGCDMEVLGVMSADPVTERHVREHLAKWRVGAGEWYKQTALRAIKKLLP